MFEWYFSELITGQLQDFNGLIVIYKRWS